MKVDRLSVTELNLFYWCPMKWYWTRTGKKGIKVDDTALLVGKAVHSAIQLYFDTLPQEITEEAIERKAMETFISFCGPGVSPERMREYAQKFIQWEKFRLRNWAQYRPDFTERKLEAQIGGVLLVGVVDFYCRGTIIDWKSTSNPYFVEDRARQAKGYEILLRNNNYEVSRILFYDLNRGTAVETPKMSDDLFQRQLSEALRQMEEERFRPQMSGRCKNCEYILDCELYDSCLWLS
jgi:hypothetical protein